ncbi:recombinase RecQ [Actinosynnema sp. ALI-1.44]|uniref:RecQ family ATP-dependent DNA helicase n=1 Tax=Actinosynnema sp. ALI-1.44 TaxID=1933779 RepID=UPI00097BBCB0|nr:RecQ family ATP-dependent DNA helicase [Actinosynnema sp. ALI-1.44]ONI87822.1 recombinase RecQ [Actinosynnema sp. ALI-1.44]
MTHAEQLRRLAAEKFGWSRLRDEQLAAMEAVMAGHDVLAVLPTGSGKSAIYQVPALLLDGPALVVSPLIALQHDQIEGIRDSEAPPAVAVNSTQRKAERDQAWEAVSERGAEYIFLAPEQLARDDVRTRLADLGVSLFVVDEAHCVSAWGHDFRPDYLRLAPVIERLGHPRVIALTATAAPPVREDIASRLGLRDHREVVASFDRPNLHLAVRRWTDDTTKRNAILSDVRALTSDPASRTGLLYTASRKDAEFYADELVNTGVRAAAYHAGMGSAARDDVHRRFMAGDIDVVVATSAFGMGIDKPDVRFVLHASVVDSLDTYYQQIGRAGRDDEPATVVLHYRPEDLGLQKFLAGGKGPEHAVQRVARALHDNTGPVAVADLVPGTPAAQRTRAINLLDQAGALTTADTGDLVGLRSGLPFQQAVDQAMEVFDAHRRLIRSRLEMMRQYAETSGCRRQHLLGYFGEHKQDRCGACDTCDAGTAEDQHPGTSHFPSGASVHHREWGHGVVMSVEQDRLTVLFDDAGYRTLSLAAVEDRDLLVPDS